MAIPKLTHFSDKSWFVSRSWLKSSAGEWMCYAASPICFTQLTTNLYNPPRFFFNFLSSVSREALGRSCVMAFPFRRIKFRSVMALISAGCLVVAGLGISLQPFFCKLWTDVLTHTVQKRSSFCAKKHCPCIEIDDVCRSSLPISFLPQDSICARKMSMTSDSASHAGDIYPKSQTWIATPKKRPGALLAECLTELQEIFVQFRDLSKASQNAKLQDCKDFARSNLPEIEGLVSEI